MSASQENEMTKVRVGLQRALERYVANNPKSADLFQTASQHLPAGNTRTTLFTTPFPIAIESATGATLRTVDGKVLVDFLGEYTAGIYGHSHPTITKAIESALSLGMNFGATSPAEAELARLIKLRFEKSAGLKLLRFTNSGTEANLMAITTARAFTGRPVILVFQGGYHGSLQSWRDGSSADVPTNIPGEYVVARYNDRESVESALSKLAPNSLAAVLVEPMQGAAGSRPASPAFLRFLREKTQELNALLIFDEVMTSRLHWNGGLGGKYGIKPDLITMGKYLGGGMSFGLFGGRANMMNLYNPVTGGTVSGANSRFGPSASLSLAHSGTFNNNLMTMHAGIAGAQLLTEDVLDSLNEKGDRLRQSLSELLVSRRFIVNSPDEGREPDIDATPRGKVWVSGIGSLLSIHFGVNDELDDLRDLYWFHLLESGFYIARRGFITLNIALMDTDIDAFLKATRSFLDEWCVEA